MPLIPRESEDGAAKDWVAQRRSGSYAGPQTFIPLFMNPLSLRPAVLCEESQDTHEKHVACPSIQ